MNFLERNHFIGDLKNDKWLEFIKCQKSCDYCTSKATNFYFAILIVITSSLQYLIKCMRYAIMLNGNKTIVIKVLGCQDCNL